MTPVAPPSPRQPEDALGDHVALDLGRPPHDRLRAGVEVGAAALLVEQRPRPEHLHRQLLEALVGLAAEHFLDRGLDPRLPRAEKARQAPVADQAEQLHLDVRLREPLAVPRVGERPPGGGMRARSAEQALEAPPDRALEGEGPYRPAFVREDAHRDLPAGAGRTHHHLGRHAHVLEEDLRELRVAGDLPQGAHADARAPHVDQEEADAMVLRRLGLGAAEEEAPVGDVGVAGPHLLAVHDEAVAAALAARAQRAQVRAGAGLGEALAPEILAREQAGEEAPALRLGAVAEDGRADQVDVGAGGRPRRARAIERLFEEPALDDCRAPAALLARPGDRRPAALVELPLPVARDRQPERIVGARPAVVAPPGGRHVRLEPGARLLGEGQLARREREVHVAPLRSIRAWVLTPLRCAAKRRAVPAEIQQTDRHARARPHSWLAARRQTPRRPTSTGATLGLTNPVSAARICWV